ncbi:N-acetylmuramidase domain-containing protein [Roseitranquillus sediminis]|uniref:N-acetylmuramidase domain-containing protein n=1 Tax=Roseitranquillus sediminis TaxID=2809051 RepID=UPI001D0C9499|nr:N-acetylmuramidase domain-containing protein [Roseitranquillus sediminis]MBM9595120.1 DUF3380 domain-containing protein [Roseitranquillus sediminis]
MCPRRLPDRNDRPAASSRLSTWSRKTMYPVAYLTREDQLAAAERLGVDIAVIKAVTAVEARGTGYIRNTDMPWILFEGHWFHRLTRGVYTDRYPHLSYPTWTKKFYKGGRGEYDRLIEAIGLCDEPDPALKSASWGLFQIMGFNHELAGFPDVRRFVNAMATSEGAQLDAFVSFVLAQPVMAEHLREKRWAEFAKRYNGPGYQQNQYDTKLAAEFTRARQQMTEAVIGESLAIERGDTAALQSALNVAIGANLVTDGWMGAKTKDAIALFQRREGLPDTGAVDPETASRLGVDLSAYG